MADEIKKIETKVETVEDKELKLLEIQAKKLEMAEKEAALQARLLEIKERTANIEDIEERLAERKLKRETGMQNAHTNGATLKQIQSNEAKIQKRCNHRKGGKGAEGVVAGRGNAPEYAFLPHQMADGALWIRCLRCGKTWKPVLRKWFANDADYLAAKTDYEWAINANTNNTMSTSYQFKWGDNGEYYKDITRYTTFR